MKVLEDSEAPKSKRPSCADAKSAMGVSEIRAYLIAVLIITEPYYLGVYIRGPLFRKALAIATAISLREAGGLESPANSKQCILRLRCWSKGS